MEIDWTTFFLEIVNFLILVWLLQRLFYKPVQEAIAARQGAIDKSLEEARRARVEAEGIRSQYEGRLADWEAEKQKAREALERDLEAERAAREARLAAALEQEREKNRILEKRRLGELEKAAGERGVERAARFASKLLNRLNGPELEARLVAALCEDIESLPADVAARVRAAYARDPQARVLAVSAYALSEGVRGLLRSKLRALAGPEAAVEFSEDRSLGAGLRVDLGAWVLHANLRDELSYFAEEERHGA